MRLYIGGERGAGKVCHLSEGDRFTIGRSPDNHIQFLDQAVSRKHCQVGVEGGRAFVRDLGSGNGTFVGKKRIKEAELHNCDRLIVGNNWLEVYIAPEKAAPARKATRCISCQAKLPMGSGKLCEKCASKPDPFVGTKIKNYKVIELIGRGGMASVYKAEQEPLDRLVALKILMADPMDEKAQYDRFLRGAKLNCRFDHPNIVRLYDADFIKDVCFLAMEYVEGESVQDRLDWAGRFPEEVAARYALQLASALECIHENDAVHRDVKPANVLLTKEDTTKLTDLGIAKELTQSGLTWVTSTGLGLGTLHYMPPEQMQDAKHADARSDLYSLGATLYAMLAGRPPFDADSTLELVRMVQEAEPKPLSGVSQKMETLVWRLLRKDPAERFGSASEVERELS